MLFNPPARGALASRMLRALICDPELQTQNQACEVSWCSSRVCYMFLTRVNLTLVFCLRQFRVLLYDYLEAACALLFELLLLGQEVSLCDTKL